MAQYLTPSTVANHGYVCVHEQTHTHIHFKLKEKFMSVPSTKNKKFNTRTDGGENQVTATYQRRNVYLYLNISVCACTETSLDTT